jgi:hypothetical protein
MVNGAWQPTFTAARYVMSAEEFGYWQSTPRNQIADQHAGFADSVLPVYQAGLLDLVADDHVITDGIRLMPGGQMASGGSSIVADDVFADQPDGVPCSRIDGQLEDIGTVVVTDRVKHASRLGNLG